MKCLKYYHLCIKYVKIFKQTKEGTKKVPIAVTMSTSKINFVRKLPGSKFVTTFIFYKGKNY